MAGKPKVRIRMYRQGLGDCFLLTFYPEEVKEKRVHMLIDCGTIAQGRGVPIGDVIDDIMTETGGHIHILVATHEHQDHVSGFNETTPDGKRRFDKFQIDDTWLAWTEDVESVKAAKIPKGKIKDDTLNALKLTEEKLRAKKDPSKEDKQVLQKLVSAIELIKLEAGPTGDDHLFGADGSPGFSFTVDGAMKYVASKNSRYFSPGDRIIPKNDELAKNWRFYVFGPPKDIKQISIVDDQKGGTELYLSAGNFAASAQFLASGLPMNEYRNSEQLGADGTSRAQFDSGFPFDAFFRIEKGGSDDEYKSLANNYESQQWRCIDNDWLASVDDLALRMNSLTNNTSLVLAIESINDRRVLLFPGDAQLGNWQTWDGSPEPGTEGSTNDQANKSLKSRKIDFPPEGNDSPMTDSVDLLKRTVFYKVGHHSSHNATTRAGLMVMNTDEKISKEQKLVAVVPVESREAAGKHPGWNMPDAELYTALLEKTEGKVLRADLGWPFVHEHQPEEGEQDIQKPPLWDKKDLSSGSKQIRSWPKVSEMIKSYQANILKKATLKDNKYVYVDPKRKYRIEYPVKDPVDKTEIPNPGGNYVDYFLL